MGMNKAQLENLKPQDRAHVRQLAHQTEQGFDELLKALEPYPKARAYNRESGQARHHLLALVAAKRRNASAHD